MGVCMTLDGVECVTAHCLVIQPNQYSSFRLPSLHLSTTQLVRLFQVCRMAQVGHPTSVDVDVFQPEVLHSNPLSLHILRECLFPLAIPISISFDCQSEWSAAL
jgi:hypothetical protein